MGKLLQPGSCYTNVAAPVVAFTNRWTVTTRGEKMPQTCLSIGRVKYTDSWPSSLIRIPQVSIPLRILCAEQFFPFVPSTELDQIYSSSRVVRETYFHSKEYKVESSMLIGFYVNGLLTYPPTARAIDVYMLSPTIAPSFNNKHNHSCISDV